MDITRKGDHVIVDINDDRKQVIELYRINFGGDHAFVVRLPNGEHEIFNILRDAVSSVAGIILFRATEAKEEAAERFLRYLAD
jgi:hypothetical protein